MAVRQLRADEWPAYRSIRLEALRDAPDALGANYANESMLGDHEWRERAAGTDRSVFVADGPDGLVGLALGAPAPSMPSVAALFSMWVAPAARRQGIGTELIEAVRAWATNAGYPTLALGVTTTNAAAIALCRSLGFTETGDHFPLRQDTGLVIQIMMVPLEPCAGG